MSSRRADRRLWFVIAALLPTVVVFWANAVFVWNHFVRGPFLHDSGWYAAIVWRSGLLPRNPPSVHEIREYYGIHFSPLVSIGSLLSYLAPIGMVRWYAVFQGAIYAPLGAAVAFLVGREGERPSIRDAFAVAAIGLVFAFNGQVIACTGFPHYEILVATGLCLFLAGLATNRTRLAWVGVVLTAITREDGGFHVTFFAAAVVASDLLGRPFPVARKKVLVMGAVGMASSVVAFGLQKTCFTTANLFRHEYLGEPAFHHLSGAVLATRLRQLYSQAAFIAFPLVASVLLAIVRRDPRYLLGWVAELPWLLLNFLAAQDLKASFSIYTGFPFVASLFWVGAYGRVVAPEPTRRGWLIPLAGVSLLSTFGLFQSFPGVVTDFPRSAFVPRPAPKSLEAFTAALDAQPEAFGRIYTDPGITSWAPSKIDEHSRLFVPTARVFDGRTGAAFFVDGLWREGLIDFLVASPFDVCGQLPDARVFFCGRNESTFPPNFVRSSPLLAMSAHSPSVQAEGRGLRVERGGEQAGIFGPFARLERGYYVVGWTLRWLTCVPGDGPRAAIDVYSDGTVIASRDVADEEKPELPFSLPFDGKALELRIWARSCGFVAEDLRIRLAE